MASLGSLVLELAANTARLQADLGRAATIAERGARDMARSMTSVQRSIDEGFRKTFESVSLGLSIFAGVHLKRVFREIVSLAAESNKDFAASFDQVKEAFKDLATPK